MSPCLTHLLLRHQLTTFLMPMMRVAPALLLVLAVVLVPAVVLGLGLRLQQVTRRLAQLQALAVLWAPMASG